MVIFQPDRFYLRKLIQKYGHLVTGRMLDVGAGEVDRYAKFFSFSERITTDVHAGTNVDVVASADSLPFADASFDSVVLTQVLEHVADPALVLAELFRVLKPGGVLLATVPLTAPLHEEPHDYYRYTEYGLRHLLSNSGFSITELEREGGFFTTLAQLRIRHLIDRFSLYSKPLLGRVASRVFRWYATYMMRRDERAHDGKDKYTLGYIVVARKGDQA